MSPDACTRFIRIIISHLMSNDLCMYNAKTSLIQLPVCMKNAYSKTYRKFLFDYIEYLRKLNGKKNC